MSLQVTFYNDSFKKKKVRQRGKCSQCISEHILPSTIGLFRSWNLINYACMVFVVVVSIFYFLLYVSWLRNTVLIYSVFNDTNLQCLLFNSLLNSLCHVTTRCFFWCTFKWLHHTIPADTAKLLFYGVILDSDLHFYGFIVVSFKPD